MTCDVLAGLTGNLLHLPGRAATEQVIHTLDLRLSLDFSKLITHAVIISHILHIADNSETHRVIWILHISKHHMDHCEKCDSTNVDYLTRVIGYLKRVSAFSEARQKEAKKRYYE